MTDFVAQLFATVAGALFQLHISNIRFNICAQAGPLCFEWWQARLRASAVWRHLQIPLPREAPECAKRPELLELLFEMLTRMEFWLLVATILPLRNSGEFIQECLVQLADSLPIPTTHKCPSHRKSYLCDMGQPALPHRVCSIFDEGPHDHWTVRKHASHSRTSWAAARAAAAHRTPTLRAQTNRHLISAHYISQNWSDWYLLRTEISIIPISRNIMC